MFVILMFGCCVRAEDEAFSHAGSASAPAAHSKNSLLTLGRLRHGKSPSSRLGVSVLSRLASALCGRGARYAPFYVLVFAGVSSYARQRHNLKTSVQDFQVSLLSFGNHVVTGVLTPATGVVQVEEYSY